MQLYSRVFLAIIASFLLSRCQQDHDRIDHCMGRKDAYFVGGTWVPYTIKGRRYVPQKCYSYDLIGTASWYGPMFHGKKTASGQTYDQYKFTAAHRTLPIPSVVEVTNISEGKGYGRKVQVLITDRGPYVDGSNRIIDLSKAAFMQLDSTCKGVIKVRVRVLEAETKTLVLKMTSQPYTQKKTAQKK